MYSSGLYCAALKVDFLYLGSVYGGVMPRGQSDEPVAGERLFQRARSTALVGLYR
jgi:hypothetical protein